MNNKLPWFTALTASFIGLLGRSRVTPESLVPSVSAPVPATCAVQKPRRSSAALRERRWQTMLAELTVFQAEHGHLKVPSNLPQYVSLRSWLNCQHVTRSAHKLSGHRLQALTTLGLKWRLSSKARQVRQAAWDSRLGQVLAFKAANGHTNVPSNRAELVGLHSWLSNQKSQARHQTLQHGRVIKLSQVVALRAAA